MSKKKTHEEYVEELAVKNPNAIAFDKYINADTPILHYCIAHGIFWGTTPSRALQGAGCQECKLEKFRKIRCKTHEQYVKEVFAINPDIIVIGEYIDAIAPIKHYCKKHNIHWNASPDSVLHDHGCLKCGGEKIRAKKIKSHTEYVNDLFTVNPNIEVLEEYKGAFVAIWHRCKIDGYEWLAKPANILFGKGCPQCNESKGERQTRQWLEKHNIKYEYQKPFDDCKDIKALPFDFYLPEYNICIEYDGEQHFRPVKFDGKDDKIAIEQFERTKYHDVIKTKYCKDNDICLLRIPYFKNIEEELEKFFIH